MKRLMSQSLRDWEAPKAVGQVMQDVQPEGLSSSSGLSVFLFVCVLFLGEAYSV